jgi:hypothetical protein
LVSGNEDVGGPVTVKGNGVLAAGFVFLVMVMVQMAFD